MQQSPWHTGPYAELAGALLPTDDPRPALPLPQLLRAETLERLLLQVYGPALMPSQRPVLVSQWSKYYFMRWLPAMLVTQLAYGWHLPLQLWQIALVLDERGLPVGIKPLEEGEADDPQASLEPWVAVNLRPFVEALSRYGEVPAAVLWGNAGDYLEQSMQRLRALGLKTLGPVEALLGMRRLADGRSNPLYAPVSYAGDGRRQRRTCCLSYKVQAIGHCEHCPLL